MVGGIENLLQSADKKGDLNAVNPKGLEAQVKKDKGMKQDDAIALQMALDKFNAAKREVEAGKAVEESTVVEKTAEEVLMAAMEKVKGNAETGMEVTQRNMNKAQKGNLKDLLTRQQGQNMPKPPMMPPQGIASAMPPKTPQTPPQMPQQMPQQMPPQMAAKGGLMRFQEGGDVEDPEKKRNLLGTVGTAALALGSLHPLGRLARGAVSLAPKAIGGLRGLAQKAYTKPDFKNVRTKGTKKDPKTGKEVEFDYKQPRYFGEGTPNFGRTLKSGEPIKGQIPRVFDIGRTSATTALGGLGLVGLGALTADDTPQVAPLQEVPMQEEPGFAPPAEKQMTEREALMARKPGIPTRERTFADRFQTMAANLEGGAPTALKAMQAQDEADFQRVFDRAIAERKSWATELQDLTTRDVSKMSNLRQYATQLMTIKQNMIELISDQSGIESLRMLAASGDEDAAAKLAVAEQQLLTRIASMLSVTGIADKEREVQERLGESLGLESIDVDTDAAVAGALQRNITGP